MSNLPDDPTTWTQEDQQKIRSKLNRLYWIFIYTAIVFVAYCIGWFQGYTA